MINPYYHIEKKTVRNTLVVLAVFFLTAGCTLFRPEERSLIPEGTPETFTLYSENTGPLNDFWWKGFSSRELDRLIETALGKSFDLRSAYARLKQARAYAKISAADMMPELDATAGFTHKKTETDGASSGVSTTNTFSLGLAAGYELDLWGRIRSLKEADRLAFEESREAYRTAAMTVAAEVAGVWIDIIAKRKEIAFAEETVRTNESILEILELRFEKSQATSLDVLQQRQAVASARSALPSLEAEEKVLLNDLALLTGMPSLAAESVKEAALPSMPPLPETGIPADLLSKRPDIRAAGLSLRSADWEVSAARAARLPALSLSASGTWSSSEVSDLFDNWVGNLAASLTGPIFDAGRRKAAVRKARAVAEERLADYEKTVIASVHEVGNALVNEDRQAAYLKAIENEHEAASLALQEATRRYLAGQTTFITMQNNLITVQSLAAKRIRQNAALLKYRVALYRTLGGNWTFTETKKGEGLPEMAAGSQDKSLNRNETNEQGETLQ